jgi:phage terminase large subunit
VYSEFPLHNPMARQYLSPIIRENGGSEIIQGTPRGKNHAYHLYQAAQHDPQWFTTKLTIEDTKRHDGSPVVTVEDVEQERKLGMSDELIRQEWYCDWAVGVQGAYFTREMDRLEDEKHITLFDIPRDIPVFTSWDLGVSDPTCITFWQPNNLGGINCIYYHESTDRGVDFYARLLRELAQRFGWQYRYHFAPHDIMQREWGAGARSGMSLAQEQGVHFIRVPNLTKDDQIQSLRALLPRMKFHAEYCRPLIDALKEYRREWDEVNRVFKSKPLHNWCSHPVDSLIYGAVAWRDNFVRPDNNKSITYSLDAFVPSQSYPNQQSANSSGTRGGVLL